MRANSEDPIGALSGGGWRSRWPPRCMHAGLRENRQWIIDSPMCCPSSSNYCSLRHPVSSWPAGPPWPRQERKISIIIEHACKRMSVWLHGCMARHHILRPPFTTHTILKRILENTRTKSEAEVMEALEASFEIDTNTNYEVAACFGFEHQVLFGLL